MQDDRKRKREDSIACPYLGTIRRGVLDFDLEPTCSVTLQTGHVYACLVCGKYFRGKGSNTPAYTHAVEESHFVYVHLETGSFHCLPDNYVVQDASLRDISETLHPSFTPQMIQSLDTNDTTSTDLLGRIYRPGFIGLSSSTDCFNAVVQALIHIPPIRDFFLNPSWNSRQLSTKHAHASAVTQGFGDLVRHVWNDRRFKSSVDPHRFVHVISDKFARQPPEAGEFLAWLLDQLHLGTGGSRKKPQSSVIQRTFQGQVRVTTQKWELPEVKKVRVEDNRLGSDDEEDMEVDKKKPERIKKETVINSHFLHLKLDLDDKPLFRDADGGLVIPQEPLSKLLSKFDGKTQVGNGVDTLRRYELLQLPRYLILHLSRFKLNNYSREKNPTIVIFPMKDLDLAQYVQGPKKDLPSADQIKSMSVSAFTFMMTSCLTMFRRSRNSRTLLENTAFNPNSTEL